MYKSASGFYSRHRNLVDGGDLPDKFKRKKKRDHWRPGIRNRTRFRRTVSLDRYLLSFLRGNIRAWNEWRRTNPEVRPDLSGADLRGLDLRNANLCGAILSEVNLTNADLLKADLRNADLSRTDIRRAKNWTRAYLNGATFDPPSHAAHTANAKHADNQVRTHSTNLSVNRPTSPQDPRQTRRVRVRVAAISNGTAARIRYYSDYCSNSEEQILHDLTHGSVPEEALVKKCCWTTICRVRGRHSRNIDPEIWSRICTERGYLLYRKDPRGF